MAEFLLIKGGKVNAINELGRTPLGNAIGSKIHEIVNFLRKQGCKTAVELKTEGN